MHNSLRVLNVQRLRKKHIYSNKILVLFEYDGINLVVGAM